MSCYLNLSCFIIFARITITATLKLLQNLPVWVVIRLCTDDESMVDYWNSIETQVMLNMDVLDDPSGEAQEVLRYFSFLHSAVLYCIVLNWCVMLCRTTVYHTVLYYTFLHNVTSCCSILCYGILFYTIVYNTIR